MGNGVSKNERRRVDISYKILMNLYAEGTSMSADSFRHYVLTLNGQKLTLTLDQDRTDTLTIL